jgi:hypothetical protein
MTADGADTNTTRRRVVRGGVALGIALLGAGFLRPYVPLDEDGPATGPAPADPAGPRRSLSISVTDGPVVGLPTPTGGRDPVAAERSSGPWVDPSTVSAPEPTEEDDPEEPPGDPGGGGGGGGEEESPTTPTPGGSDLVVNAPPLRFANVVPGSRGRTTATASLAGDPADLWLAAAGVDGGENGLTEPERTAGDDAARGELVDALRVTLAVGGTTLYDGPLAGVDVAGVRVAGCATGDVPVTVDWALPETAGNEVQTDGAGIALRLGATDCGAPDPFAA